MAGMVLAVYLAKRAGRQGPTAGRVETPLHEAGA